MSQRMKNSELSVCMFICLSMYLSPTSPLPSYPTMSAIQQEISMAEEGPSVQNEGKERKMQVEAEMSGI